MFKNLVFNSNSIRVFVACSMLFCSVLAKADDFVTDTVHTHKLGTLTVNGQHLQTVRAALPVQMYTQKELTTLNATNVADVAKHFAGVSVKDYGGIGGLKTVSIRGLGAQHTGVCYDGVMVSDVQSGQIDLSQFTIENIAEVSLTNGQPNSLLQPARMFASSGVLCFTTQLPEFDANHTLTGRISAKGGSFGLINPQVYVCKNITRKWASSLSVNGLTANGAYPFVSNLNLQGQQLVQKNRINSDVQSIRSELNSIYRFNPYEYISVKVNQYYSERGLPGADTYYISYATDRLRDKNYLAQIQYQNRKDCYFQYQFSGRMNRASMLFSEESPNYSAEINHTRTDNYAQNEYYLTSAFQTFFNANFTVSGALDWWYNDLLSSSNMRFRKDASPTRHTGLANVAAKYTTEKLTIGTNLLYTFTRETNQTGDAAADRNKLSPTVAVSYKPFASREFRLRSFFKNIFRLPTFNDLYYHDFGYSKLEPEITNQYNVGMTYFDTKLPFVSELECTLDAYYNKVTDKISVVYGMPFSSVRNIGRVDIKGVDVSLKLAKALTAKSNIRLSANYTYQLAQDNSPESDTYLDIIPYAPIHSGAGSLTYQQGSWECGTNSIFSGKRYSGQNSNKLNLLKSYMDHSVFLRVKILKFSVLAEALNLTNKNYEVVQFFPMPGRNYRMTISYKF